MEFRQCAHATLSLRSKSNEPCWGTVNLYSKEEARVSGFDKEVQLCKKHYDRAIAKNRQCCYPLSGPCSSVLVSCPSRLFPTFSALSDKIGTFICETHFKEADSVETITHHELYEAPYSRKVGKFRYQTEKKEKIDIFPLFIKIKD